MLTNIDATILAPGDQDTYIVATEGDFDDDEYKVPVNLSAEILSTGHGDLVLKWFSGVQNELTRTTLTELQPRLWTITEQLLVGSHVMTFTAQDKDDALVTQEMLPALYTSMEHFGSAGGPPENGIDQPRIVHVLAAKIIKPSTVSPVLSKGSAILAAQAPLQWADFNDPTLPDPTYHATNQIQFRWFFRRSGVPDVELDTSLGELLLIPPDNTIAVPRLRYTGPLPGSLQNGTNNYTLILRVQQIGNEAMRHEQSITVSITD